MARMTSEQIGVCELSIVKTIPIIIDEHAVRTVGQFIDEMLEHARQNSDRVSQVTVKLDEKNW